MLNIKKKNVCNQLILIFCHGLTSTNFILKLLSSQLLLETMNLTKLISRILFKLLHLILLIFFILCFRIYVKNVSIII